MPRMTGASCEPCRTPARRESKTAHTEIVGVVMVMTVLVESADRTHKQAETSMYQGGVINGVGDDHLRRTVTLGEQVRKDKGKEMTPKTTATSCETGATGWRRRLWNRGHTRMVRGKRKGDKQCHPIVEGGNKRRLRAWNGANTDERDHLPPRARISRHILYLRCARPRAREPRLFCRWRLRSSFLSWSV